MRWLPATLLSVVLVGTAPAVLGQSTELGRAQNLVREGKAEEAWKLLSPLERQYAGQPEFDYLLAVAALESGRANLATFILERVVVANPGHVAARLELARAYFALGDFERAEREFDFVLGTDPPEQVRSLVARYRDKLRDARSPEAAGIFSGYAEGTVGRDTNANAAAARGSLFIPSLGAELVLDPELVRRADEFASLGAGLQYAKPLGASLSLLAGGDIRQRWHDDLHAVDSLAFDLHLRLKQRLDARDGMQYTVHHGEFDVDQPRYQRMQSAIAEWSRVAGERARLAFSAHGYRIRYVREDARASSSNLFGLGANAAYVLDAATRTVALGGAFIGIDDAVRDRADGDRRLYGVSGALQRLVHPRVDVFVSVALLDSDYRRTNPDFGVTRRDRVLDTAVGLSWQLADGWSLRPQVARTVHRSNIAVNDYRRTETSLTLRRVWD
jgi:tetratricopeptide (TPR) repeat protein